MTFDAASSKPYPERKPNLLLNNVQINGKNSFPKAYDNQKSYYANAKLFGDIGKDMPSALREQTKSTAKIENIVTTVIPNSDDITNRDYKAYDIGAKAMGMGGRDFANSDAYKAFINVNSDDFIPQTYTDFKTKEQTTDYFYNTAKTGENTSDGKITHFSTETFGCNEYYCIKDKENNILVFDKNGKTAPDDAQKYFNEMNNIE